MSESIFSADTPVSPDVYVFRTNHLDFVAAVVCINLYAYLGVEPAPDGRTGIFLLEDPSRTAHEARRRFSLSQFEKVDPRIYAEARHFLLGEVARMRNTAVAREVV
jgi:hypothetical protein